jgi:hypothetical protein
MSKPKIAIIVYKVFKRQVNETRVPDQNRNRQFASVILIAEYLLSGFRLHVRRDFISDSLERSRIAFSFSPNRLGKVEDMSVPNTYFVPWSQGHSRSGNVLQYDS